MLNTIFDGGYPVRWFHHGLKRDLVRCAGAATLAILGASILLTPAHTQAKTTETSCRDLAIPVSIPVSSRLGLRQTMHGTLCTPHGARTVQVLVPGGTYTSAYWDITYTPEIRSFGLAMNKAGYATLALDRLGTGRSSKPPSVLLTATAQAGAVHQVIKAIRSGSQGPRFDKVILAGHSVGSAITIIEAGTYHDVDAVLITGLAHKLNPVRAIPIFASLMPVALDPKMSRQGLDPGYVTTRSATRYASFHHPGPNIPAVIDLDESTKDALSLGEMVDTALLGVVFPYTRRISAPVLLVMADGDRGFCGPLATDCSSAQALHRSEALYYPPAARLKTFVLPGYGHSFNYAPNAPDYHKAVAQWADNTVGQ